MDNGRTKYIKTAAKNGSENNQRRALVAAANNSAALRDWNVFCGRQAKARDGAR